MSGRTREAARKSTAPLGGVLPYRAAAVIVSTLVLVAALGASLSAAQGGNRSPSGHRGRGIRACRSTQLGMRAIQVPGAMPATFAQVLVYVDESSSACTLSGYPAVTAVATRSHFTLVARDKATGYLDELGPSGAPREIVLADHGAAASSVVQYQGAATDQTVLPRCVGPAHHVLVVRVLRVFIGGGMPHVLHVSMGICNAFIASPYVRGPTGRSSGSLDGSSMSTSIHTWSSAKPRSAGSTSSPIARLGTGGGWADTSASLEVTTNAGRTFSITKPPIPSREIRTVAINGNRITVAGSNAAQAAVPDAEISIAASTDDGRKWSPPTSVTSPPGTPPDAVQLVSSGGSVVGMLVTALSPPASWGVWFSTANDGATWTEEARVLPGGKVTSAGGAFWLVGDETNQDLLRSTDDGKQWSAVRLPELIAGDALDLAGAFVTGRAVLVADTSDPVSGVRVDVLTTSNAGTTWTTLARTSFLGGLGNGVPMSASVAGNAVWIAGSGSRPQVVESTGKVTVGTAPRRRATVQSVSAASSSVAWATAVASSCPDGKTSCHDSWWLYRTSNSGIRWNPVDLVPSGD